MAFCGRLANKSDAAAIAARIVKELVVPDKVNYSMRFYHREKTKSNRPGRIAFIVFLAASHNEDSLFKLLDFLFRPEI